MSAPVDSELPSLYWIDHNAILNAGAWKMLSEARKTGAPEEVISWLVADGKKALHAAYDGMRDYIEEHDLSAQ